MTKNTKKKVFTLMLVIILLSIAIVGGSLAWFSAEDEVTNTFTVGSIEVKQIEVFDKDNAMLLPVIGTDPESTEDYYIEKKVTVQNTGKNPAYVQTLVAVPAPLDNSGILKLWDINHQAYGWTKLYSDSNPYFSNLLIDGEKMQYNVYIYRYNTALDIGETTEACLEYVYIDSQTDMNAFDTDLDGYADSGFFVAAGKEVPEFDVISDKLNIYVVTQAVQTEGFPDPQTALDQIFGEAPSSSSWNNSI